jgi:hypothetical protein
MRKEKTMKFSIPQPLLDDICSGQCLPFIGAGFSLNACLPNGKQMPDWNGLSDELAIHLGKKGKKTPPEISQLYEKRFGRVQLIEAIRKALYIGDCEPGKAHKAFASLPFETVYTTNFDLIIEDAYSSIKRPFRSLVGDTQLPFHGGPLTTSIIKMHGDLKHEEQIIVTSEDYSNYLDSHPVIATHLAAMLITKTALFIGYSLSDPDFSNIRSIVRQRLGSFERMSYLIQFDSNPEKMDKLLSEKVHVISLKTSNAYGKDELLGAFFSQVQNVVDAKANKKFRMKHPDAFEETPETQVQKAFDHNDFSTVFTSSSNLCFVMMPFDKMRNPIYSQLIKPAAENFGLTVVRADEIMAPGVITEQIRAAIQQSRICIADISGQNPNVLYEVGLAQAIGKPVLLLAQSADKLPFDFRSLRVHLYNIRHPEKHLDYLLKSIEVVLGEDRRNEAQRLIDSGMYRAAAAILGVLLEHTLRQTLQNIPNLVIQEKRRPIPLVESVRLVQNAGLINEDLSNELKRSIQIRNKAVHDLKEPSKSDVNIMYDTVNKLIETLKNH